MWHFETVNMNFFDNPLWRKVLIFARFEYFPKTGMIPCGAMRSWIQTERLDVFAFVLCAATVRLKLTLIQMCSTADETKSQLHQRSLSSLFLCAAFCTKGHQMAMKKREKKKIPLSLPVLFYPRSLKGPFWKGKFNVTTVWSKSGSWCLKRNILSSFDMGVRHRGVTH